MVQRPRPDLRGGWAAMRIPTVTGVRGTDIDGRTSKPSDDACWSEPPATAASRRQRCRAGGETWACGEAATLAKALETFAAT